MTKEHQICKVKSFKTGYALLHEFIENLWDSHDKIYRQEILFEAWKRVKKNRGSCGVDKVHIRTVIEDIGVDVFLRISANV